MPRIGGICHVGRQIAGIALPLSERDCTPCERPLGKYRLGDRVCPDRFFFAAQVVAEHDRPALDARGKHSVVVEPAAQLLVRGLKCSVVAQVLLCQRVQRLNARAGVALRPDNVEGNDCNPVLVEQLVHEARHDVAAPGPAADLTQAFLVDVEDDDAPIARAGHRQPQARVVDNAVELDDEPDLVDPRRVPMKKKAIASPIRIRTMCCFN